MIQDARVLQPEFLPNEVRHRDAEVSHLSHALEPITEGDRAETAFLHGPSGTGKTCISKWTVERLRQNALDLEYQYVNVWENHSRFKLLYELLDGIGKTLEIHRQSTPTDMLLDRLHKYDGPPYLVILDEVDQIDDTDLLYDLNRIRPLELVLIANDEDQFFARLEDRVRSRLSGCERIRFEPYSLDELRAILRDRVQWGLTQGAVDRKILDRIADAAAGDARTAIAILRAAARQANRNDRTTIPLEVAVDVIPEAKSEIRQADLDRLTPEQQKLYEIIQGAGEIQPAELYEAYKVQVEDPKTKRTVRNHLSKLEHYNLIEAHGATRNRSYSVIR